MLKQLSRTSKATRLFRGSKRKLFAKVTLLDHLCDPEQFPSWHTELSENIRLLPEAQQAVSNFEKKQWTTCATSIERSMEICESIPQMKCNVVHFSFGQIHCALQENMQIIHPKRWNALTSEALRRISRIIFLEDGNSASHSSYAKWVAFAAHFLHTNEGSEFEKIMERCVKLLRQAKSKYCCRAQLLHSLVSVSQRTLITDYPSTILEDVRRVMPNLFASTDVCADAVVQSIPKHIIEALTIICAESFRRTPDSKDASVSSDSDFQKLFVPRVERVAKTAGEKRYDEIFLPWALNVVTKANPDENSQDNQKLTLRPEIFVSMCLSMKNCPLDVMQRALRLSKAINDENAETREILTAISLRTLALRYQYNYVYFSGLYTAAINQLEKWLKRSPGISLEAIENAVNRLMRREYVRLLLDLGQKKEAESLIRRHKLE